MRFAVTKTSGGARLGTLYTGNTLRPIQTPALLLSTRKGLPAFIARDLLAALPLPDSLLLHTSPLHFMECPPPRTVSSIGGLHQILGLHDHVFVAAPRDSIECLPESGGASKLGASFETPSGRRQVNPAKYMELISSLKPNMWASLADEVPAWVPEKRNKSSVDRTLRWLDDLLALDPAGGSNILGSVVGGSNMEERKRCATEVAKRSVSGFWIGGFGFGESMEERPALLTAVVDRLPEQKLRLVSGLGLPEEVLLGVAAGIDIFDSTYIYHLTLGGFALIFPLDNVESNDFDFHPSDIGCDSTKINLRATIYRHNTHHYLGFFRSIREAIKSNTFDLFHEGFIKGRRAHLSLAKSAQESQFVAA